MVRIENWQGLINSSQLKPEKEKLEIVNNFINKISFSEDIGVWKKENYWTTPIEFITRNAGDSENYIIAKYVSLRALGVPDDRLRIMYVNLLKPKKSHMVLAYDEQPNSMPMVLDNINIKILLGNYREDLLPIL